SPLPTFTLSLHDALPISRLDAPLAPQASSCGPYVLDGRPEAILAILRSARSAAPDPLLSEVLEAFRRQWLAFARKRYPDLRDDRSEEHTSELQSLRHLVC